MHKQAKENFSNIFFMRMNQFAYHVDDLFTAAHRENEYLYILLSVLMKKIHNLHYDIIP